jgi:hypothetical protein
MKESRNLSIAVGGIFFLLFLVFVIANDFDSPTGNVVLDTSSVVEANYGSVISGGLTFTIESGEFVDNDSIIRLSVLNGATSLKSVDRSANDLFVAHLGLTKVKVGEEYGFNVAGDYNFDASYFDIKLYEEGERELKLEYLVGDSVTVVDSSTVMFNSPSDSGLDEVEVVAFGAFSNDSAEALSDKLLPGDFLTCSVNYTTGVVDIEFFGPGDVQPYEAFTSVAKITMVEYEALDRSSEKIAFCLEEGSLCVAYITVNETRKGNWKCRGRVTNSNGKFEVVANNVLMANSPPTLKDPIPNYNLSSDGLYNSSVKLDMDSYFEDIDPGDTLEFFVSNGKYVSATINNQNKIVFSNPKGYEGLENYSVRAMDEDDGYVYSNVFVIKFGTGSNVPDTTLATCVASWECSPWSSCSGSQQSRSCIDVKGCGSLVGKPSEAQSCSDNNGGQGSASSVVKGQSVKGEFNPIFLVILFVVLGAAIGLGAFFFMKYKKKKVLAAELEEEDVESSVDDDGFMTEEVTEDKLKEIEKSVEEMPAAEEVKDNVVNTNEVDDYMIKAFESGVDEGKIKESLIGAGWEEKVVVEKMAFYKAKQYVKSKSKQGLSRDMIKESLKGSGWKDDQIEKLFE